MSNLVFGTNVFKLITYIFTTLITMECDYFQTNFFWTSLAKSTKALKVYPSGLKIMSNRIQNSHSQLQTRNNYLLNLLSSKGQTSLYGDAREILMSK